MIEVKATKEEYEKLIDIILNGEGMICYGMRCITNKSCSDCIKERIIILKEEVKYAE